MIAPATGIQPLVAGKPEPPLHRESVIRTGADPLVVGDRLDTDIEGAHPAGADSLLVLTGASRPADVVLAPPSQRPTYLAEDLAGLLEPYPAESLLADDARRLQLRRLDGAPGRGPPGTHRTGRAHRRPARPVRRRLGGRRPTAPAETRSGLRSSASAATARPGRRRAGRARRHARRPDWRHARSPGVYASAHVTSRPAGNPSGCHRRCSRACSVLRVAVLRVVADDDPRADRCRHRRPLVRAARRELAKDFPLTPQLTADMSAAPEIALLASAVPGPGGPPGRGARQPHAADARHHGTTAEDARRRTRAMVGPGPLSTQPVRS